MSHLACADDPDAKMNRIQLDRFRTALAMLPPAPASFASSGGVLLGKDYAFDMVRPGIGLYGGNAQNAAPNPFRRRRRPARAACCSSAELTGARALDTEPRFRAKRPTVLATVALGYADGLMRAIGNRGHGAIAGMRAPIAGRVSMDLVTLDVTDVPRAALSTDAEAEFFGDTITLEDVARGRRHRAL